MWGRGKKHWSALVLSSPVADKKVAEDTMKNLEMQRKHWTPVTNPVETTEPAQSQPSEMDPSEPSRKDLRRKLKDLKDENGEFY